MRIWFSGPRILGGLIRPGISLGKEDFRPPRLPSWRRHELRAGLQAAAKARGEAMTKDDANYCIDKALATGMLDSKGDLDFKVKGTRDKCIEQIIKMAAAWNQPMTGAQAGAIVDRQTQAGVRVVVGFLAWLLLSGFFTYLIIHAFAG